MKLALQILNFLPRHLKPMYVAHQGRAFWEIELSIFSSTVDSDESTEQNSPKSRVIFGKGTGFTGSSKQDKPWYMVKYGRNTVSLTKH